MRPPARKASPQQSIGAPGVQALAAFCVPVRVYYQDTDAGGVVFHGRFLSFFERARTEWLRQLGFDVRQLADQEGILFIVRELRINYLRPAHIDDLLTVTAAIENLGRAQFTLDQLVLRGADLLVHGSVNLACVSIDGLRPARVPPRLYAALGHSAGRETIHEEEA
jgi:acyl-CoA thioester hydrolase